MTTDTLTIRLLDREVALTPIDGYPDQWQSADKVVWCARYRSGIWASRLCLNGVNAYGWSHDGRDECIADLDTRLRRLREWLNG